MGTYPLTLSTTLLEHLLMPGICSLSLSPLFILTFLIFRDAALSSTTESDIDSSEQIVNSCNIKRENTRSLRKVPQCKGRRVSITEEEYRGIDDSTEGEDDIVSL